MNEVELLKLEELISYTQRYPKSISNASVHTNYVKYSPAGKGFEWLFQSVSVL